MEKIAVDPRTLYVVATPIGNLSDLTDRAKNILSGVDFILCEDTRHSAPMLEHFNIRNKLISYFAHNEAMRTGQFLPRLIDGESAAIISDAGTPGISDPGARIVDACLNAGIRVCPVPGPCAAVCAVAASGFYAFPGFEFIAFFPRKSSERQSLFQNFEHQQKLLVGYESPQRIVELLSDLEAVLGAERRVCLARELTKKFETLCRGTVADDRKKLEESPVKGEICLVVEGSLPDESNDDNAFTPEAQKLADCLISRNLSAKDIRDIVAEFCNVRPKLVYQYVLSKRS